MKQSASERRKAGVELKGSQNKPLGPIEEHPTQIMHLMDADRDDFVDKKEVEVFAKRFCPAITYVILDKNDVNEDGVLTWEEEAHDRMHREIFEFADANKDGKATSNEILQQVYDEFMDNMQALWEKFGRDKETGEKLDKIPATKEVESFMWHHLIPDALVEVLDKFHTFILHVGAGFNAHRPLVAPRVRSHLTMGARAGYGWRQQARGP